MAKPVVIKKYSNRRLYDTGTSKYVTIGELTERIRGGTDVVVVDAKSGEDLTQATLTQIIIEGRNLARMLPVNLLVQLIRLGDDALADFFSRYVTWTLELYLQAKRGAQAITPFNPFAQVPFAASDALARLWMASPFSRQPAVEPPPPPAPAPEPDARKRGEGEPDASASEQLAALRRELDELRAAVTGKRKKKKSKKPEPDDD